MRDGAGLAVAAVAALAVASSWSRRTGGSRGVTIRQPKSIVRPSFLEVAELVYHGYPIGEILNTFPDHTSLLLGGKRLVVATDRGDMVVTLNARGQPQMYRSTR